MQVGLALVALFWGLGGTEAGLVALWGYLLGEALFPDKKPWQK